MANKLEWPRNLACEILSHPVAKQHGFHYAMIHDCTDEKIEAALESALKKACRGIGHLEYFVLACDYYKRGRTFKQIGDQLGISVEGARQKIREAWVAIVRRENLLPDFVLDCTGQSDDMLKFLKE